MSFRTSTLTPSKTGHALITARIIFQFVHRRSRIRERLRSRCELWQRFSIRMLGEYSDLYLKTDVLLLADIFENFRNNCIASYCLDPAHYYTLPGFTWDAMLKHTHARVAHQHWYGHVHRARYTRRPQSMFRQACTHANNKYMRSFDRNRRRTWYTTMWIICTDERCVNLCHIPNFNESKTLRTLMWARSLRTHSPVIFSRSISSICNIYMTDTLTYLSAQRAINRPASVKLNF